MTARIKDIIKIMNNIAPEYLAEDWDNVGLHVGNDDKKINKILLSLEVTQEVIDEAIKKGAELIISHHPLIFKPVKSVLGNDPLGKMIHKIIKHDISIYCAHTNYDITWGGNNDFLTKLLNLNNVTVLTENKEIFYKLVVFVPKSHVQQVKNSLCKSGAGFIGNYSDCTFSTEGIGTFKPLQNTKPYIGIVNKLEEVEEYRVETIIPKTKLNIAINNMLKEHPYEEVAYDIYLLENDFNANGLGRVGKLEKETTLEELCKLIKEKLNIESITYVGSPNKCIKKVGICSGSGADLIKNAYSKQCDCFITGDIKYHDAQNALQIGISLIDAGHFHTEKIFTKSLAKSLTNEIIKNNLNVEIFESNIDINPFNTI